MTASSVSNAKRMVDADDPLGYYTTLCVPIDATTEFILHQFRAIALNLDADKLRMLKGTDEYGKLTKIVS
jgi:hypothetical protein